jgi:hypothetical protein
MLTLAPILTLTLIPGVASHLRAGACVDSCGGGYFAEDQPLVRTCQPCHTSCQACTRPGLGRGYTYPNP